MSLSFISKCCLFCRQDNGGEDKHLRHQLWTSLRHRHGESRFQMCFFPSPTPVLSTMGRFSTLQTLLDHLRSTYRGKSAFFALFLVLLQPPPPAVVIASSLQVSPHAAVLKWAEFSTRQHNVYSSDNFPLINDLKRPLVIPATSLFILGSPVYHAKASRPPSHRVISDC